MTIEQLQEANRIANRIEELKGFGFRIQPDYKKAAETLRRVTLYYDGGAIDLDLNESIKSILAEQLTNMDDNRAKEIAELEIKLSQL